MGGPAVAALAFARIGAWCRDETEAGARERDNG